MKIKLLLFLILFIAAGIFVVAKAVNKPEIVKTQISAKENIFSPQTSSEGDVEVNAVPKVSADKKSWSFQITLTTHAGSLDEDLVVISSLADEEGNKLDPIRWEGTDPGGHHREGVLVFPPFSQTPKSVKLILRSIGEIPERNFTWSNK